MAEQFLSIKEKNGSQAFLTGSWGSHWDRDPRWPFGGHTSVADSTSYGSYPAEHLPSTLGIGGNGFSTGNDRFDILNADTGWFLS